MKPAALISAVVLVLMTQACTRTSTLVRETGGDPKAGRAVIAHYGCTACHSIPGISETGDVTGPSLAHVGSAKTLAGGRVPNTPQNMVRWVQSPSLLKPGTSMPAMNVNDKDARDIAAFLVTLR